MVQLELPLVYQPVYQPAKTRNYQLPLRWKAVFVLLLIYSIISSAIIYGKITQTHAETAQSPEVKTPAHIVNVQAPDDSATLPAGTTQVKMTATVPGWYDIVEIDNTNLLLKTNMQVWVNGREFIRCDSGDQQTTDLSLLDL